MDRKALGQRVKETKVDAGVYPIRNDGNGRALVESARNLGTMQGQRFSLETGAHRNAGLLRDWNEFGKEAFAFVVLEVRDRPDTAHFDKHGALNKLKTKWLDRRRPWYNLAGAGEG